jgi:hypothetical protein
VQSPFGGERNANPYAHLFAAPSAAQKAQVMDKLMSSLRTEFYESGGSQMLGAGRPRNEAAANVGAANGENANGQAGKVEPAQGNSVARATEPKKPAPDKRNSRQQSEARNLARQLEKALARADALNALKDTPKPIHSRPDR